ILVRGADAFDGCGRPRRRRRYASRRGTPRGQRTQACTKLFMLRTGRSCGCPRALMMLRPGWFAEWQIGAGRAARGTLGRESLDGRSREVGWSRSTGEAAKQARGTGGGGGGGKATSQGERGQRNTFRTQCRVGRVK